MKVLQIVVLAVLVAVSCASVRPKTIHELVALAKHAPRDQLKAEVKAYLSLIQNRAAIDDSIINFLDTTVREIIKTGNAELGIPVLDPLAVEHLDLNLDLDQIAVSGVVDGVEVEGISTFVIDHIKLNILLLNAEFGFHVPEIIASGDHYNIEGTVEGLIPIYGEGAFSASLKGLAISGKIYLGSNNSFIYIKQLDLDFSIESLTTNFEGLLGGGELGDLANEIISDMAPEVIENAKPTLIPTISEAIINLANEKLDGVTLQDILDLINGNGGIKKQ